MTEFGTLHPEGSYVVKGKVEQGDMLRCPYSIIEFEHYRPDGTCRCDDPEEQQRLVREYDYKAADFA